MNQIKINGKVYVEKDYKSIPYSSWSPRAFVIGFALGSAIMGIFLLSTFVSLSD